jgi:hypothetical protein
MNGGHRHRAGSTFCVADFDHLMEPKSGRPDFAAVAHRGKKAQANSYPIPRACTRPWSPRTFRGLKFPENKKKEFVDFSLFFPFQQVKFFTGFNLLHINSLLFK